MFSEALKRILNRRGQTQKWLADQTGFTAISISRYINGSRLPDAHAIRMICNALNCSADELLEIEHIQTDGTAPAIHSRWICGGDGIIKCENCQNRNGTAFPVVERNTDNSVTAKIKMSRYCCSCGAKMNVQD